MDLSRSRWRELPTPLLDERAIMKPMKTRTPGSVRAPVVIAVLTTGVVAAAWAWSCHVDPRASSEPVRPAPLVAESGCFDDGNLSTSWFMDERSVRWNGETARFEDGHFANGAREGCWTVWHKDGLFDSDASGTYAGGRKVESAPSPLGDFGDGE